MKEAKKKRLEERLKRRNEELDLYYDAEKKIISGAQSYTIGSRSLTRADLSAIKSRIDELEDEVDELEETLYGGSARKAVRIVPRDW